MFMLMTKEQNRHMSASPGSNEDNNPDPNYEIRPIMNSAQFPYRTFSRKLASTIKMENSLGHAI